MRHLAHAQAAAHHQLEADLVADGAEGRAVGQGPAVDGEEARHRVRAGGQRRRQQGGEARVEHAGQAPVARRRRARGVAGAHHHVAAGVELRQQVGDALRRMRQVGVHHHDVVVAGVGDALQHGLRQVGPHAAAHLDAHRQPPGEPPRDVEGVVVGVVVDEQQLPREAAAGQGPGHALGQRLEVGGLSQRRHHDRHRRVFVGQGSSRLSCGRNDGSKLSTGPRRCRRRAAAAVRDRREGRCRHRRYVARRLNAAATGARLRYRGCGTRSRFPDSPPGRGSAQVLLIREFVLSHGDAGEPGSGRGSFRLKRAGMTGFSGV